MHTHYSLIVYFQRPKATTLRSPIVGFEVRPESRRNGCSDRDGEDTLQRIAAGETLLYTYDVLFLEVSRPNLVVRVGSAHRN